MSFLNHLQVPWLAIVAVVILKDFLQDENGSNQPTLNTFNESDINVSDVSSVSSWSKRQILTPQWKSPLYLYTLVDI